VRKTLLDLFDEHPAVLDDPKPSVFIDAITDGKVGFNAFAFVAGPRAVYSTRSALLFSVLEKFRADGIKLVAPA
jgi:potassium efflux system protein